MWSRSDGRKSDCIPCHSGWRLFKSHGPLSFCVLVKNDEILLANRFFWLITFKMDVSLDWGKPGTVRNVCRCLDEPWDLGTDLFLNTPFRTATAPPGQTVLAKQHWLDLLMGISLPGQTGELAENQAMGFESKPASDSSIPYTVNKSARQPPQPSASIKGGWSFLPCLLGPVDKIFNKLKIQNVWKLVLLWQQLQ